MNPIISVLEEKGLVTSESVENAVLRRPLAELESLQEQLYHAVKEGEEVAGPASEGDDLDPFNFLASSCIRGDSGCVRWECRLKKVRMLSRYAALYCEQVIFPIRLGTETDPERDEEGFRSVFGGSLLSLLELRPLIDSGLVRLVRDELHFCARHMAGAVPAMPQIIGTARRMSRENLRRFSASYEAPHSRKYGPFVYLNGPTDYLEHGKILRAYEQIPPWVPLTIRHSERRVRLSRALLRKSRIVDELFIQIADDALLQQFYGVRFNAKYLTDLPGEARFLNALGYDRQLAEYTAPLCAHLTHEVPLFSEVPIHTVLRIRAEDYEAFQQYRRAMTNILNGYVRQKRPVGAKEAKEIFQDILLPEVLKLKTQAKSQRRATLRKAATKAIASAAIVGLGVFGGIVPSDFARLVQAVAGLSLLKEIGESLLAKEKNPAEIRNNNFYFLLRLAQERR